MVSIGLWFLVAQVLPRVGNPWPTNIGLGFPFAVAGAAASLADLVFSESSPARRDRISRKAGVYGFRFGLSIYGLALLVQLLSKP